MTSPAEAQSAIRTHVTVLPAELTPLQRLAGAVLREPVVATRDQPPFDRVMMDGIAIAMPAYTGGCREFRVAGTQAAGVRQMLLVNPDACFEVMTGAMVPHGCDAVIPLEQVTLQAGVARLADHVVPVIGMNIHARGLDCRAGIALLEPGTRLGPAEIAVIASTGLARVAVTRSPRIAVISTGDELIEPGGAVEEWQIYRSNTYGVLATLRQRGFHSLAHDHLPDDLAVLRQRLRAHLDDHDVLVLSGGVSMGKFDYIPQVLDELNIRRVFHKIEQRPGRPMWFGVGANGKAVYALPGNPVSTLVCLLRYVVPGLDAALGATIRPPDLVVLSEDVAVKSALTLFLAVSLETQAGGRRTAQPRPTRGSGDFTALLGTDGFVELPPGPQIVPQGSVVPLYRW